MNTERWNLLAKQGSDNNESAEFLGREDPILQTYSGRLEKTNLRTDKLTTSPQCVVYLHVCKSAKTHKKA